MKRRPANSLRWGWVVGIGLLVASLFGLRWIGQQPQVVPLAPSETTVPQTPERPSTELLPVPALPAIKYLNAAADAQYVGSQACAECHADEHASYHQTAHSRALETVNLEREPPDAAWRHVRSGRDLRTVRDGSSLVHAQQLMDATGMPAIVEERPLRYAIGSGHHSRSYLAEIDGFLVESPLTWYAAKQGWDMSPGYDTAEHIGFERQADFGCLVCHAGRVEMESGNRDRVKLHELAIGCENCHGPGSLHVQHRTSSRRNAAEETGRDAEDLTIVHPQRLPRAEQDALCAGCHLRGAASVFRRGRSLADWRPGRRLTDVRLDYVAADSGDAMTVVGHMEQMRASACYVKSGTLTCITCHDPHFAPAASDKIAYFRQKCVECHRENCSLPAAERLAKNATDDCVACHMPQRPADLPHFAFTHHRIGLHRDKPATVTEPKGAPTIVPFEAIEGLSSADQDRCLGLAYLEFASKQRSDQARAECLAQAERLLMGAQAGGAGDVEVLAGLARLAWERGDWAASRQWAAAAMAQNDRGSGAATNALVVKAHSAFSQRDFPGAIEAAQKLTTLRRRSEDWLLLGRALGASGDFPKAASALSKVIEIQPFQAEARLLLAGTYERLHQPQQAREQSSIAELLSKPRP